MIRLEFLGRLADLAGAASQELAQAGPLDLAALIVAAGFTPALREAVVAPRTRIARNGELIAAGDLSAVAGDAIAFLPPVSGG